MPGMRLTFAQACRLWQVDATTCDAVLRSLIAQGFLYQRADGTYATYPATPRTAVKAKLPDEVSDRAAARRGA